MINILLALRARDQSGQGCLIDIAMTDAMFTFAWQALALGAVGGQFPKSGELELTGGSPRYALYPTKDGRLIACGALEQKFWLAFTAAIGMAAEVIDDRRNPKATRDAVAKLIIARTADEWAPLFAKADCCVTIVKPLEEALRDPHFIERGLFAHEIKTSSERQSGRCHCRSIRSSARTHPIKSLRPLQVAHAILPRRTAHDALEGGAEGALGLVTQRHGNF